MKRLVLALFAVGCADAYQPQQTTGDITPEFETSEQIADPQTIVANVENVTQPIPTTVVDDVDSHVVMSGGLPAQEELFFEFMNQERRDRGLEPLATYWGLEDDALTHSQLMADTENLHHNPHLSSVVPGGYWKRLGENVGVGGTPLSLHQAFMNSPAHRANVLQPDYTHVGIKAVNDERGFLWVTFVFMETDIDNIDETFGPFHDDDFSVHERSISKIYDAKITVGCSQTPLSFCPGASVTRGQMAAFLVRALDLPPSDVDAFTDDDGAWFERAANALAASGITKGCGATSFCGNDDVTRGQMATFLNRAFRYPTADVDYFVDDGGRFYEPSANNLAAAGITKGCGPDMFCGERAVTRAEMATFLTRALGL